MGRFVTRSSISSDSIPDQFTFTDQSSVSLSSTITSAALTVTGLGSGVSILFTATGGGTIDKNGDGNFQTTQTLQNTDTFRARHTSSSSNSTAVNTVVTGGGISDTFTSTTVSAGGELGELGDYAGLSLSTFSIYTVDLQEQDYPTFTNGDAHVDYGAAFGIDGRAGVRCFPPDASGEYGALGSFNLFEGGGSSNFTNFYMRWCMQVGSTYAQNNLFDAVKYCIIHSQNAGTGGSDPIRPIFYLDGRPGDQAIAPSGSAVLYPAQGTSQYFSESYPSNSVYDGDGRFDFFFGQSATTYNGKRVIAPSDWVCVEIYCESAQTGTWPNGVIRQRVTARDGTVLSDLDIACPWNRDASAPFTKYFYEVQVLGGYYNGTTTTAGANNYTAIDRYVTFAKNQSDFLGPPPGFLT